MPYYKYLRPERIDVLNNLKIRFTQVSALNDPFEYFPAVSSSDRDPFKEIEFQRRIRSITESTLGILCLSKTPSNILMWSHYAASHSGFLIEFDSNHGYFNHGTSEVRYSHNRPRMLAKAGDQATDIFYTKGIDWRYEKEVRKVKYLHQRIRRLSNGHSIIEGDPAAIDDPLLIHLCDFPKDAVTGIALGWKSTPVLQTAVADALAAHGMASVRLYRCQPCRKEYRMQMASLD
jgi:hypothetical protein